MLRLLADFQQIGLSILGFFSGWIQFFIFALVALIICLPIYFIRWLVIRLVNKKYFEIEKKCEDQGHEIFKLKYENKRLSELNQLLRKKVTELENSNRGLKAMNTRLTNNNKSLEATILKMVMKP